MGWPLSVGVQSGSWVCGVRITVPAGVTIASGIVRGSSGLLSTSDRESSSSRQDGGWLGLDLETLAGTE